MAGHNSGFERRGAVYGTQLDSILSSSRAPGSSDEDLEASEIFLRATLNPEYLGNRREQERVTTRASFQDENPFQNPESTVVSGSSSSRVIPVLLPVDGPDTNQAAPSDYSTSDYSSHPGAELELVVSDPFADSISVASLWEQILDDRYSDPAFSRNFEESIPSLRDQHSLPRLGSPGPPVPSTGLEKGHTVSSVGQKPTVESRRDSGDLSDPELLPFTLGSPLEPTSITSGSVHENVTERHKPELSISKRRDRDSSPGAKPSERLRATASGIRSVLKNLLHRQSSESSTPFTDRQTKLASSSGLLGKWRHRRSEFTAKRHI